MLKDFVSQSVACSMAVTCVLMTLPTMAAATDFTAGTVMEKMPATERYPYISGVIEGVAYARYIRDEKKSEGMLCIYDWFYKDPSKTLDLIYAAFGQYPKFTPAAIITALAEKRCPKS